MSTMTHTTRRVKASSRPRQPRTVRVLERPTADAEGRLLVTQGPASDLYFVREISSQIPGRAFRVEKFGMDAGESYAVLIGHNPAESSCECKGFNYCGHCRHVEALTLLTNRNLV